MKRKIFIFIYIIGLFCCIAGFILCGKFVWVDCAALIQNGYTQEIGLGMGLFIFYALGFFIPGAIVEFVKFCMSSGSPVDK